MHELNYVATILPAISRKHAIPILLELATEKKRYKDILVACDLDDQQLSRALRELLKGELVEREPLASTMPIRVHYNLTWKGRATLDWLNEFEYVLSIFV